MKRSRIPEVTYYEWSVAMWRASATRMMLDAAGRGIYRELLDTCYNQGSILNPDKDAAFLEALARDCAVTTDQFQTTWKLIRRHFIAHKHDPNLLVNKRANVIRKSFFMYMQVQRKNGGTKRGRGSDTESKGLEATGTPTARNKGKPREDDDEVKRRRRETEDDDVPLARRDNIRQLLSDFAAEVGGGPPVPDDGMVARIDADLRGASTDELKAYLLGLLSGRKPYQWTNWAYLAGSIRNYFASDGRKRVITDETAAAIH
jgi:hypothetical protein